MTPSASDHELDRILALIRTEAGPDAPACVLVSGGLDSDVVARLAVRALTSARVKLVTIRQDDMMRTHLDQAHALAGALGTEFAEIDFRGLNVEAVARMAAGDPTGGFDPEGLLDPARMKCSLRTIVASSYQDRGYVVLGTSNLTETRLGFFLPFGDGLWHVGPIAHLYKSEVRRLGVLLGTAAAVLGQPPSAGFWADQTDREDLGFWLVHRGPIQREREFTEAEVAEAAALSAQLDEDALDAYLDGGLAAVRSAFSRDLVERLDSLVARSAVLKGRPTGVVLPRRES